MNRNELLLYLEQQHTARMRQCANALRDDDMPAVQRALTVLFGVDPPANDAECRAELFRLMRVSTPSRDEIERVRRIPDK